MNKTISDHIIVQLQELYQANPAAKAFFDWAASRLNDAAETAIERIVQKARITLPEARRLGRALEELTCGEYIEGRKGHKSRISWNYSLRSLGAAAQGKGTELTDVDPELKEDTADQLVVGAVEEIVTDKPLTIAAAKRGLAAAFHVSPDAIDIVIRG
jgi:hypothetical protein